MKSWKRDSNNPSRKSDPDEILSGNMHDLSLFKSLGYIPNDDISLSETENDESEDTLSRQRIEGSRRSVITE